MGLKLELSLFYQVEPDRLWDELRAFFGDRVKPVMPRDEPYQTTVHEPDGDWALITSGYGWDSEQTQEVHRHASGALSCVSLFVAVSDGDYWCYELWRDGRSLDRFRQDPAPDIDYFPDDPAAEGNPGVLAAQFPWLATADVAPYLVRRPDHQRFASGNERLDREAYRDEFKRLNVRARPGDQFTRFDECAVMDFLKLLRVGIEVRHDAEGSPFGTVQLTTPVRHRFFLAPPGGRSFGNRMRCGGKCRGPLAHRRGRRRAAERANGPCPCLSGGAAEAFRTALRRMRRVAA